MSLSLLHRVQYPNYTEDQFEYLIAKCRRHGIDPWSGHAHLLCSPGTVRNQVAFTIRLEGLRARAAQQGYRWRRVGPFWAAKDLKWRNAWNGKEHPFAARVGIVLSGECHATWGVAHWSESAMQVLTDKGTAELAPFWRQRPAQMLGKTAEKNAIYATFPETMNQLYAADGLEDISPTELRVSGSGSFQSSAVKIRELVEGRDH